MSSHTTHRSYVKALELICRDDDLRRKMLWLWSMQRQDVETARLLERTDHGLLSRVAEVHAAANGLDPVSASALYRRAHDDLLRSVQDELE